MKVKELIQKLEGFDEDCQIELYYQAFLLNSVAFGYFDIERIRFEERTYDDVVVLEVKERDWEKES